MEPGEEDKRESDDDLKTSTLVKEQEARASKDDLKRLERTLEEERRHSEELLANLRYLQADFENYRKRVDKETREREEFSTLALIRDLIPVLDDLDLAVATSTRAGDKGFSEGVKMVRKNLTSVLEAEGLREINAIGLPFDPSTHEAVDKFQGTENTEDMVVEEMRKGYTFKGKVVRPSAVKVELAKPRGQDGESPQ